MKIAVCVKQVPKGDALMDKNTGLLIRKDLKTNLYDNFAIETALQIKDKYNATVDVFSLAPPIAKDNFKEYYSLGIDKCYLVTDPNFKGADVYATSYTLSQAIRATDNYDLIITGRQTTDGDTSSVPGGIAESLKIPSVMYVLEINDVKKDSIILTRELTSSIEKVEIKTPFVLSVDKDIVTPRIPTLISKLKANKQEVECIGIDNLLDTDNTHYGENGSKTKVVKIYEEETLEKGVYINGSTKDLSNFIINEVENIKR